MRRLLYLLAILVLGCTGSESVSTTAVVPDQPRGSIHLEQDLINEDGPGSGIPPSITGLEVVPLDANQAALEQPQTLSPVPASADVSVPLDTRFLRLSYLEGAVVRGQLTLPTGANLQVIEDPLAPVVLVSLGSSVQARSDGAQQFLLLVQGQTMQVKGVGFDYTLEADANGGTFFSYVDPQIAQSGANTIRTYGVGWNFKNAQQQAALISSLLALCKQKNLYLLAGLVFDPGQGDMSTLIPQTVNLVRADPNYDRLLGWVIGNEIPSSQFSQLNGVLTTLKQTNPNSQTDRPLMTAVPSVSAGFVSTIKTQLPALDWLAINNFYGQFDATHKGGGFLDQQTQNLVSGGWSKPWIISEYYSYDLPADTMPFSTLSGKPYYYELNSTDNAANYTRSFTDYVVSMAAVQAGSLGGCVLNWGPPHNSKIPAFWKMTHCYRGQFTAFVNPPWSGGSTIDRLACADAVATLYGGSLSSKPCPKIVVTDGDPQAIVCSFKASLAQPNPTPVVASSMQTASVTTSDSGAVTCDWYLVGGSSAGFTGDINAAQKDPFDYGGVTSSFLGNGTTAGNVNTISFTAPPTSGNVYQLRVIVRDNQGGAATAAVGFSIQ